MKTATANVPLIALLMIFLPGTSPAGDWPQWRYDAGRSATSPDELPGELHLQWERQLPQPRPAWPSSQPSLRFDVSYSPVAAGKMLYVPSMVTDTLTAYDTEAGAEKWCYYADGPVRFAPIFHNGKIYFGSDDGYLYCLDAGKGTPVWKLRGGPYDRKVLGNERLISTWPVRSAPLLHDGKVYFTAGIWCFMGIFVHVVDPETGKTGWLNSGAGSEFRDQPHRGAVAFASFIPRGYPAIVGDLLAVPGGRTPPGYYNLVNGTLVRHDWVTKGGRRWNINGDGNSIKTGSQTVSATSGTVTVGDWKGNFEGDPWNVLAADGKLFVVTTAGRIYCFGAKQVKPKTYDRPAQKDAPAQPPPAGTAAATVLKATGASEGYGVVLRLGDGKLPERLLRGSKLFLIVIDPDANKIGALRRRMTDAGLYGTRISAHAADPSQFHLPPYLANLLVCADLPAAGAQRGAAFVEQVFHALRPYGGAACLRIGARELEGLVKEARLANARIESAADGWSLLVREGALPDAADWTHQYADAGNSVVSKDKLVKAPLGLLWFGNGPPNDEVLPRHGHGPSPQVAAGRLFIEGADMLRGIDIYTGRLLWQRDLPGLGRFYNNTRHQPGAGEIGSNYVSLADAVYVVYGEKILRLDAASGETTKEFTLAAADGENPPRWGYIGAWKDLLVAGSSPVAVSAERFTPVEYSSASKRLVVMDRRSGKVLWTREARYSFRHNNIALGADKVFCIDGLSRRKQEAWKRRGRDPQQNPDYRPGLLALDVKTGKAIWTTGEHVFGTFLNYSAEHDVLLQSGSAYRDRARDESNTGMVAYRGKDGSVIWKDLELSHGGPCILHHDTIIPQGPGYSLLTGQRKFRKHPLSGKPIEWGFTRAYGCNTAIASEHLITFRSGAAGFYDLAGDGGTGNFGGFKSGCTSNLIVAGGLLNAPEYTRTCSCNYQNQTSLALVHDPRTETWTFNPFVWDGAPVQRVGINFGAPGDRLAGGTLWLDWPSRGGPSPNIPVEVEPQQPVYYRQHASRFQVADGSEGLTWVAASGVCRVRTVTLTLAKDRPPARKHTVRLHFAEADDIQAGQRVFNVSLQDKRVLADFDIIKAAGGRYRATVKEFTGIDVTDKLKISIEPSANSGSLPPILSGIEVVAEGS